MKLFFDSILTIRRAMTHAIAIKKPMMNLALYHLSEVGK
jgi:hypothetical protein